MQRKFILLSALFLTGCKMVVLNPSGDIANQQSNLLILATGLMLIIVIPVILMTVFFALRYRASNQNAVYTPEWHHSTRLELLIWGGPLIIIIALGLITWITTHTLDPYRPLDRIKPNQPVSADVKPLVVEVVALDWKWLFIYPDLGIATVNELAAPINVPITFKITASTVMNSFFIPALAGQIYAMPSMQTKLHAVINQQGVYEGFSANYSGAGFSKMRFKFTGMSESDFDSWVSSVKDTKEELTRENYLALEKPSIAEPVRHYSAVGVRLYDAILDRSIANNDMCMSPTVVANLQHLVTVSELTKGDSNGH